MQIEEFPSERAILHFTFLKWNHDSCRSELWLLRKKKSSPCPLPAGLVLWEAPVVAVRWLGTRSSALLMRCYVYPLAEWGSGWIGWGEPCAPRWSGCPGHAAGAGGESDSSSSVTPLHDCPGHWLSSPRGWLMKSLPAAGQFPSMAGIQTQKGAQVQTPCPDTTDVFVTPSPMEEKSGEGNYPVTLFDKVGEDASSLPPTFYQHTSFCKVKFGTNF